MPSSREIAQWSREPRALVRACLFLVLLSLMISGTIAALKPMGESLSSPSRDRQLYLLGAEIDPDLDADTLAAIIRNRTLVLIGRIPGDFREMTFYQGSEDRRSPDYPLIRRRIESSTALSEGVRERLYLLLDGIHGTGEERESARDSLLDLDESKRYRNEFLGDVLLALRQPEKAIARYVEEGSRHPDAAYSIRSAVVAYTEREEPEKLRETLSSHPGFWRVLGPRESLAAAAAIGDYGRLFASAFAYDWMQLGSPVVLVALFCASIWFAILAIVGRLTRAGLAWGFLSLLLGMVSTTLTLYFVYIQEHLRNFTHHPEDSLLNQLIAMVAGIGLREETLKLLCYVPVAFLILRLRNPLLALTTAAMTGLGFAMMENIQYFAKSTDEFEPWGRLLSANALHFCLTGIAGFSFYRLLRYRGRGWENFLLDFLLVVFLHGAYDAFILVPQLAEYGIASLVILALTAYRFLDLVRDNMTPEGQHRRIAPLGVFVVGSTLLACGIMILSVIQHGFLDALAGFAGAIASSIPLAFAFISRLREM